MKRSSQDQQKPRSQAGTVKDSPAARLKCDAGTGIHSMSCVPLVDMGQVVLVMVPCYARNKLSATYCGTL